MVTRKEYDDWRSCGKWREERPWVEPRIEENLDSVD